LARSGVLRFGPGPCLQRVTAVEAPGERLERFLGGLELACGDGEQPVDRQRDPFVELQLLLEFLAAYPERSTRAWSNLGFERLDIRGDRLRRFGLRVGEIA